MRRIWRGEEWGEALPGWWGMHQVTIKHEAVLRPADPAAGMTIVGETQVLVLESAVDVQLALAGNARLCAKSLEKAPSASVLLPTFQDNNNATSEIEKLRFAMVRVRAMPGVTPTGTVTITIDKAGVSGGGLSHVVSPNLAGEPQPDVCLLFAHSTGIAVTTGDMVKATPSEGATGWLATVEVGGRATLSV